MLPPSHANSRWSAGLISEGGRTHVMVAWLEDDKNPRSERYEWLRAGDVTRTVSWFVAPPARVVESRETRSGAAPKADVAGSAQSR